MWVQSLQGSCFRLSRGGRAAFPSESPSQLFLQAGTLDVETEIKRSHVRNSTAINTCSCSTSVAEDLREYDTKPCTLHRHAV